MLLRAIIFFPPWPCSGGWILESALCDRIARSWRGVFISGSSLSSKFERACPMFRPSFFDTTTGINFAQCFNIFIIYTRWSTLLSRYCFRKFLRHFSISSVGDEAEFLYKSVSCRAIDVPRAFSRCPRRSSSRLCAPLPPDARVTLAYIHTASKTTTAQIPRWASIRTVRVHRLWPSWRPKRQTW